MDSLWAKTSAGTCLRTPNTCEMRTVRYSLRMTETEQNILAALLELEQAIESMASTTPKPNLLPFFSRLDELTRSLPSTTDPLLLHYLHKKSYQKARLFLQGREAENARGNCYGHVDEHGEPWTEQSAGSVPPAKDGSKMPPAR